MQQTPPLDKRVLDALAAWRNSRQDGWDSGFLGLIGRWVPWFDAERIEYAFDDTVAVQLHGGEPQGMGASLLMTPAAWERVCQTAGTTTIATLLATGLAPGRVYTVSLRGDVTVTSTTATNRPILQNNATR